MAKRYVEHTLGDYEEAIGLQFPDGSIPLDLLIQSENDPQLRRMLVKSIARDIVKEINFKTKHEWCPLWVYRVIRWWEYTPLWERITTVALTPITVPFAILYLLVHILIMTPLGFYWLCDKISGKEGN